MNYDIFRPGKDTTVGRNVPWGMYWNQGILYIQESANSIVEFSSRIVLVWLDDAGNLIRHCFYMNIHILRGNMPVFGECKQPGNRKQALGQSKKTSTVKENKM